MADSRQIVALNIGSQCVTMGVFARSGKNGLSLNRYASRQIVLDPTAESMRQVETSNAIASLAQELKIKGGEINFAVSGQSVFIRFLKLPAIDDTDIDQLIKFEAQQHVPFPLDDVVWDYHLLASDGLEREVILVAIKSDDLNALNTAATAPGFTTGKVDCSITAIYNAYKDSYPQEQEPVMLIDVGAKSTNLIYCEGDRFFTRSISAGGIFITSAIARDLNCSFTDAENIKIQQGMVSMTNGQTEGMDPTTAVIATAARNAMTRLASEIQRTTNHYRAQMKGTAPVKAYLLGGGASLPYTKEFLEERLGIPVVFFNPIHNITIGKQVDPNDIAAKAFTLGSLIGIALDAVNREKININLEPKAIAKQRDAQKKIPAILTGAIIAVIGVGIYSAASFTGAQKAEKTLAEYAPIEKSIKQTEQGIRSQITTIEELDNELTLYKNLNLQRFGYADLIKTIINDANDPKYPYWFTNFEPISGFDPNNKTGMTGSSIVKESFTTDKGSSIAGYVPAPTNPNAEEEAAPQGYMANAIAITGFVMKSKGGDKVIQDLQKKIDENPNSPFTFTFNGEKLESRQILETGAKSTKMSDADSGAFVPFKLILPLKQPLPVTDNK